ncbi:galactoside O-acetyltransferase [Gallibacterium salpingitidis]|uniref:Acetyltransferase n=1 Tax=Gallibacterium salpingitidis TaxID=505341 RepID=A0AB36E2X8_9PAST|nr:sugar O-acetyltransferase [Gallibacterium salpingitidis]OBX06088.1 galactoside O-acetyltransferase [Gallibacterium salpingitidis]OBX10523.1 galactoside O-acetyltransferase [Gallibacterium salpingitidis]
MALSEQEKMLLGLPHNPYDETLSSMRKRTKQLLFQLNYHLSPSQQEERLQLLQQLLGSYGKNLHINPPFFCDYGSHIDVGDNFFANCNCTILDNGKVTIGNNVMFAPNVSLYTVGHPLDPELRQQGFEHTKPIVIEDNVWIGGNSVILGGVTIGKNAVIGAGSVVTKNIPANSLAVGNPCRVLRQITEQDRLDYQQWLASAV